jgi:hypothetical protein
LHGLLDETASSTTSGSTSVTGGSGAAPSTPSTTTTTSVTTPDARYVPVSRDPIKPLVGCP